MSMEMTSGSRHFPFFELPSELRNKIYEYVLVQPSTTIDLDPMNYRLVKPRLTCFFVCRRMHYEAYHVFYGAPRQPLRLYPIHGRFLHTKKSLLMRIGPRNRRAVRAIELSLGINWTKPAKCWHTNEELGLRDCKSLRILKIFVTCDPSQDFYDGFRGHGNGKYTYQNFCVTLLREIFAQVPSIEVVELDGWPGVAKGTPFVMALLSEVNTFGKKLAWGPVGGWGKEPDSGGLLGLESVFADMAMSDDQGVNSFELL